MKVKAPIGLLPPAEVFMCLVCGFPSVENKKESEYSLWDAYFPICPCCGVEKREEVLDKDAHSIPLMVLRNQWIAKGMQWWSVFGHQQPIDWNPQRQLHQLLRVLSRLSCATYFVPPRSKDWPRINKPQRDFRAEL